MSKFPAAAIVILSLVLSGCATVWTDGLNLAQRAKPPEGQHEIELLAGIAGRLAERDGCVGLERDYGDGPFFTTIVWPWNVELRGNRADWSLMNTITGERFAPGDTVIGGGGSFSVETDTELRRMNRGLARNIAPACARFGAASLNKDFRKGLPS